MDLKKGDRVQILANWNWPQACTGRIAAPPAVAADLGGDEPWLGCRRGVRGRKGPIEFYWVSFDEPQMDSDGDGPYSGGEVQRGPEATRACIGSSDLTAASTPLQQHAGRVNQCHQLSRASFGGVGGL
jgi:hypothetical protein